MVIYIAMEVNFQVVLQEQAAHLEVGRLVPQV